MTWPRVIAVSGTSNLGKSTLATALAGDLSWPCISTDMLARHPGRPWTTNGVELPPHVLDHYDHHSVPALTDQQLAHFRRIEPLVADAVARALIAHPRGVVVEGSALLLGTGASWLGDAHLTFLVGSSDLIWERIQRESRYASQPASAQRRIELFRDRSVLYQQRLLADLDDGDPRILALTADTGVAELVDVVLARCARSALSADRGSTPSPPAAPAAGPA